MLEVEVRPSSEGQRLLKFVKAYLREAPLSFIYRLFRKKDVKVNGHWEKEDYVLSAGDKVRLYVTEEQLADFKRKREAIEPRELPYPIAYEDENVLIVDKPSGLLVMGDSKGSANTLAKAVLAHLMWEGSYKGEEGFTPSPAHRLDRNTGGLICFGKTDKGLKALTALFQEKGEVEKVYLALVKGVPSPKEGEVDAPLLKDEKHGFVKVASVSEGAKNAKTIYRVIESFSVVSLVECRIITGRTHQIRVHMAHIGNPIIGDAKYGDFALNREFKDCYGWEHQFLRARSLTFGNVGGALAPLKGKTFLSKLSLKEERLLSALREGGSLK